MRIFRRLVVFLVTVTAVVSVMASPSYACCCVPHDLCDATGIGC